VPCTRLVRAGGRDGCRFATFHPALDPFPLTPALPAMSKNTTQIRSHHSNFVIRHSNMSAPQTPKTRIRLVVPQLLAKADPVTALSRHGWYEGGLVASRMRDGSTLAHLIFLVNI
jgi:hypothetical protein